MFHGPEADTAVAAAEAALNELDHSRLPVWLVAQIAVESAEHAWRAHYDATVVAPLRAEVRELRRRLRGESRSRERSLRSVD